MLKIDMEMPRSCKECKFRHEYHGYCTLMAFVPAWMDEVWNSTDKRSEHCPLIEDTTVNNGSIRQ